MSTFFSILLAMLVAGAGAQCPPSYTLVGDRCLWFMSDDIVYRDAAEICGFYGGSLAKVDDCNLLGEIAQYIDANGIGTFYWIGATDIVEEGTYVWTDGSEVQMGAPFWASQYTGGGREPQDDGDACVALDPLDGYYYHNEGCTNEFSAICQLDVAENSPCSAPFISVAGGCYQFLDAMPVTWEVGRSSCQGIGGDLAVIDDCSVMADIIRYIEGAGMSSHFWIGGLKVATSWVWIDGSPMAMGTPFWGYDQTGGLEPDGDTANNCMYLHSGFGYHFADYPCDYAAAPLCEAPRESQSDGPA